MIKGCLFWVMFVVVISIYGFWKVLEECLRYNLKDNEDFWWWCWEWYFLGLIDYEEVVWKEVVE